MKFASDRRLLLLAILVGVTLSSVAVIAEHPAQRISIAAIGDQDATGKQLRSPVSIHFDRYGNEVFVVDPGGKKVVIFDPDLNPRFEFQHRVPSLQGGQLEPGEPKRLVTNRHGEILLIDNVADFIDILDFRGRPVDRIYPNRLLGDTTLKIRADLIATDERDNVYVSIDGDLQAVLVLDGNLRLKRRFGQKGDRPEDFNTIVGLYASEGKIYIADVYGEPAIKVYDTLGTYLFGFARHEIDPGDLSMAQGIAVHRDTAGIQTIWVTDALRQVIKVYSDSGAYIATVGGFGEKPGEFMYPSGIAVSETGSFYIVERGSARIQRFDYR